MNTSQTFLCVANYFKGAEFLKACKELGNTVYLVTLKMLENEPWPKEYIDEIFYVNSDDEENPKMDEMISGLAYMMRSRKIHRFVALDDFDVERVGQLREHFRMPGAGETVSRYFRDKLAMRIQAKASDIPVPPFSSLFNDGDVNQFANQVAFPCLVKPRAEASAMGIQKVHSKEELWQTIHALGDKRDQYLTEQFRPGDVYHVDGLVFQGKVVFTRVSRYLNTPMEVAHGGGIFRSNVVEFGSADEKELTVLNTKLMKAFGMQYGTFHSEFIKVNETGKFVFLETASRVGGAHLVDMVEASSGINLWTEWAKIETAAALGNDYQVPTIQNHYAGIVISLSRYEYPDMSIFNDPEIVWRINKRHHVGMIVKSDNPQRILELLDQYADKIRHEYHASLPMMDKPSHG